MSRPATIPKVTQFQWGDGCLFALDEWGQLWVTAARRGDYGEMNWHRIQRPGSDDQRLAPEPSEEPALLREIKRLRGELKSCMIESESGYGDPALIAREALEKNPFNPGSGESAEPPKSQMEKLDKLADSIRNEEAWSPSEFTVDRMEGSWDPGVPVEDVERPGDYEAAVHAIQWSHWYLGNGPGGRRSKYRDDIVRGHLADVLRVIGEPLISQEMKRVQSSGIDSATDGGSIERACPSCGADNRVPRMRKGHTGETHCFMCNGHFMYSNGSEVEQKETPAEAGVEKPDVRPGQRF